MKHTHRSTAVIVLVVALAPAVALPATAVADPHADYMLHCQGCHGPDGSGAPGGIPSFHSNLGKFLSVPGGREYLIRVPGTAQSELSDARVASVLNWMAHTFSAASIPSDFLPFSAEEVARTRRPPLIDVTAARRRLVDEIDAREQTGAAAARHGRN
jgi:mono/diheme cytochrome c family protein